MKSQFVTLHLQQALVLILQQPDTITMVYSGNMDVRRVRMNQPHKDTPALYGDSVGHYEGDTLVIDTIGIRTDRKYAMIDLFGTAHTKALHMVETLSVARLRRREGRNRAKQKRELAVCRRRFQRPSRQVPATGADDRG